MTDLINKLAAAKEGSRELDAEIFKLLNPEYASDDWRLYCGGLRHKNDGSDMRERPKPQIPYYSSSVDAALTLVPEGWVLKHISYHEDEVNREFGWMCIIQGTTVLDIITETAKTLSTVITLAALKARGVE